jgi:hypothetical protein
VGKKSEVEELMDEECIAHTDHDPYSVRPLSTPIPDTSEAPDLLTLPAPIPDIVAPRAVLPAPERRQSDSAAAVHAATHVHDNEGVGPSIKDSEVLQHIFAKIDESDSDDSSDSDMERNRKRESISILPGSLESYRMARRFTGSSEESRGSGKRLRGVEE